MQLFAQLLHGLQQLTVLLDHVEQLVLALKAHALQHLFCRVRLLRRKGAHAEHVDHHLVVCRCRKRITALRLDLDVKHRQALKHAVNALRLHRLRLQALVVKRHILRLVVLAHHAEHARRIVELPHFLDDQIADFLKLAEAALCQVAADLAACLLQGGDRRARRHTGSACAVRRVVGAGRVLDLVLHILVHAQRARRDVLGVERMHHAAQVHAVHLDKVLVEVVQVVHVGDRLPVDQVARLRIDAHVFQDVPPQRVQLLLRRAANVNKAKAHRRIAQRKARRHHKGVFAVMIKSLLIAFALVFARKDDLITAEFAVVQHAAGLVVPVDHRRLVLRLALRLIGCLRFQSQVLGAHRLQLRIGAFDLLHVDVVDQKQVRAVLYVLHKRRPRHCQQVNTADRNIPESVVQLRVPHDRHAVRAACQLVRPGFRVGLFIAVALEHTRHHRVQQLRGLLVVLRARQKDGFGVVVHRVRVLVEYHIERLRTDTRRRRLSCEGSPVKLKLPPRLVVVKQVVHVKVVAVVHVKQPLVVEVLLHQPLCLGDLLLADGLSAAVQSCPLLSSFVRCCPARHLLCRCRQRLRRCRLHAHRHGHTVCVLKYSCHRSS